MHELNPPIKIYREVEILGDVINKKFRTGKHHTSYVVENPPIPTDKRIEKSERVIRRFGESVTCEHCGESFAAFNKQKRQWSPGNSSVWLQKMREWFTSDVFAESGLAVHQLFLQPVVDHTQDSENPDLLIDACTDVPDSLTVVDGLFPAYHYDVCKPCLADFYPLVNYPDKKQVLRRHGSKYIDYMDCESKLTEPTDKSTDPWYQAALRWGDLEKNPWYTVSEDQEIRRSSSESINHQSDSVRGSEEIDAEQNTDDMGDDAYMMTRSDDLQEE